MTEDTTVQCPLACAPANHRLNVAEGSKTLRAQYRLQNPHHFHTINPCSCHESVCRKQPCSRREQTHNESRKLGHKLLALRDTQLLTMSRYGSGN